jgi:S-methyl-5-thioribose-1-phosphate isomerase
MIVKNKHYKTLWFSSGKLYMIDQNSLPFEFKIVELLTTDHVCQAIKEMTVRGAGAIGVAAAYAMSLAAKEARNDTELNEKYQQIAATRPTAVNLFHGLNQVYKKAKDSSLAAKEAADRFASDDESQCQAIAQNGERLIPDGATIMTHCNAGWLAFSDWGSALAPIYLAAERGKKIRVLVSETRPRLQGARLTAWELYHQGIEHKIITDNAAAWIMASQKVDLIITGADRIALNGDTANKIGTLDKAIVANYFNVPFYVAAPMTTFDFMCPTGDAIIIENRSQLEVTHIGGLNKQQEMEEFAISNPLSKAINPAFDVTPYTLISQYITPAGILTSSKINLLKKDTNLDQASN